MNPLTRKPLPRRLFLKGAAGATLALPFLDASLAHAQEIEVPKRFVVWYTPCGVGSGSYPTSLDFGGTPYEALQPFASQLIVTRGIAMKSIAGQSTPPHPTGFGHMLTADTVSVNGDDILSARNASIDQFIAGRMQPTAVASSLHGVVNERNMSWFRAASGGVSSVRAEQDPANAFKRLFGGATPTAADTGVDTSKLRRASILDSVRDSYRSLTCQVGGEDRKRLDAHLDFVRTMEKRAADGTAMAATCMVPDAPGNSNARSIPAGRELGRAHANVLAAALACDITRVGTLQWYSHTAVHGAPYGWGGPGSHHAASHKGGTAPFDRLYAEELAFFLGALREARAEDGSSLLDHTAVLCISELAVSGEVHHLADCGIMIAGSAGGYLKTGQYLDLIGQERSSGFRRGPDWHAQAKPNEYFRPFDVPHNNLFVELANAVAPKDAEPVTTFGRADVCTGGLPQIRA